MEQPGEECAQCRSSNLPSPSSSTATDTRAAGQRGAGQDRIGGVCHSDLHIWDGFFDLGSGQKLDVSKRGMKLPFTLGHEIAGEVVAVGPDVEGRKPGGQRYVVFPWIGCGTCALCKAGDELLCPTPRTLGTRRDGGYADHVLVPHPRYLVDHGGIADRSRLHLCLLGPHRLQRDPQDARR